MRILFVAISDSIHAARWIGQLKDQQWNVHLFPSVDHGLIHPALSGVKIHQAPYEWPARHGSHLSRGLVSYLRKVVESCWPEYRANRLARVIRRLKPDIVHSLEFQSAGYLCLEAKKLMGSDFPDLDRNELGQRHLPVWQVARPSRTHRRGSCFMRLLFLRVCARHRTGQRLRSRGPSASCTSKLRRFQPRRSPVAAYRFSYLATAHDHAERVPTLGGAGIGRLAGTGAMRRSAKRLSAQDLFGKRRCRVSRRAFQRQHVSAGKSDST